MIIYKKPATRENHLQEAGPSNNNNNNRVTGGGGGAYQGDRGDGTDGGEEGNGEGEEGPVGGTTSKALYKRSSRT